jgi:hypothetical protein
MVRQFISEVFYMAQSFTATGVGALAETNPANRRVLVTALQVASVLTSPNTRKANTIYA